MHRTAQLLSAIWTLVSLPCVAAALVTVSGPTIIGFFPPASRGEIDQDDGLREGMAHVQFALEDLQSCLSPRKLVTRFELTRSLSLRDGTTTHHLDFPSDWAHSVGIVLVTPGKAPVVVYATAGPSSLSETGPQAAWKYFGEPGCKRYEE
jgi:hypothetical protein